LTLTGKHTSETVVIYNISLGGKKERRKKKKKKIKRSSYFPLPNKPGHSCTSASEQLLNKHTTGLLSSWRGSARVTRVWRGQSSSRGSNAPRANAPSGALRCPSHVWW